MAPLATTFVKFASLVRSTSQFSSRNSMEESRKYVTDPFCAASRAPHTTGTAEVRKHALPSETMSTDKKVFDED